MAAKKGPIERSITAFAEAVGELICWTGDAVGVVFNRLFARGR